MIRRTFLKLLALSTLPGAPSAPARLSGRSIYQHSSTVLGPLWSADGKRIAFASGDGSARVCDPTGKRLLTLPGHRFEPWVTWSPDGSRLATVSAGDPIRIWDAGTGQLLRTLGEAVPDPVELAWNPRGSHLALSVNQGVSLWDAGTGKRLRKLEYEKPLVTSAWSPDGKRRADLDEEGLLWIWDATGRNVETIDTKAGCSSFAWSREGRRIALGGNNGTVRVLSLAAPDKARVMRAENTDVPSVAWGPGELLASAFGDKVLRIWDAGTGKLRFVSEEQPEPVNGLAWHPTQKLLASGGGDDPHLRLWTIP